MQKFIAHNVPHVGEFFYENGQRDGVLHRYIYLNESWTGIIEQFQDV
jgi:hypothetical protein